MAPLLLISGAHGAIRSALRIPPCDSKALVITTAANPAFESGRPPTWLAQSLRALESLGFAFQPYDIAGRTRGEIEEAVQASDTIYVSGGNTFYLLHEIRASGFDAALDAFLRDPSHLYIGASAGAAVMTPDIAYTALIDDPGAAPKLRSTRGLGHIDFAVVPHAELDDAGRAVDPTIAAVIAAARRGGDTVVINDREALIVRAGRREVVPSSDVV